MESTVSQILLDLFILFAAAKIGGEIFERIGQPGVVGELLAGIIIGPGALGIISESIINETVATLGVILLLFYVGLETRASDIFDVGFEATLTALSGIVIPFLLGYGLATMVGLPTIEGLFIGTAMVATSVGITARVLTDRGYIHLKPSKVILGAAIIDDILGMMILSFVAGLAGAQRLSWLDQTVVIFQAITFVLFLALAAPKLVKTHASLLEKLHIRNAPLVVALLISLGLSALASYLGLAAIVGAFLAGMAFAETADRFALEKQTKPIYEFLVPFFFVVMGSKVELSSFANIEIIILTVAVTLLAILGKLLGCGLGALRLGFKEALAVGVGMVPRGEVGFIVATVGLVLKVIEPSLYSVVVAMAIITTMIVPPLLPRLFKTIVK
jgi:Kef-type K+ transport system membrane component KefB